MRLVGVLIGVGVVIGLMVLVMGRLDAGSKSTAKDVGVKVQAGGVVVPTSGGATGTRGDAVSAAQTVACAAESETLRTAEDTYRVLNGKYADLDTLVQSGTIRARDQELYAIASTDGFVTYHLVGEHGCP